MSIVDLHFEREKGYRWRMNPQSIHSEESRIKGQGKEKKVTDLLSLCLLWLIKVYAR